MVSTSQRLYDEAIAIDLRFDASEARVSEVEAELAGNIAAATAAAAAAAEAVLVSKVQAVADRTELAALDPDITASFDGSLWPLVSGDLSAKVTADTAKGIYVAPAASTGLATNGSQGARVRQFNGAIWFHWFGPTQGNAAGANTAVNDAAWAAVYAVLVARKWNAITNYGGLEELRYGPGTWEFGAPHEYKDGAPHITGIGDGHGSSTQVGNATRLKFYSSTGILVQASNTSGVSGFDAVAHNSASRIIIENIGIEGNFSTTEAEYHGFQTKAHFTLRNVNIRNFAGDGVHIVAGGSPVGGDANGWRMDQCQVSECRDGLYTEGNNCGAGTITGGTFFHSNRRTNYNFVDGVGSHVQVGGSAGPAAFTSKCDGVTIPAAWCSDGTNRYGVIQGQATGASTNAPSGTTADNTWWYFIAAGVADTNLGCPLWVSGMSWRVGGHILDFNSATRNVYISYAENNGPKSQIVQFSLVIGTTLASWCYQNPAPGDGTSIIASVADAVVQIQPAVSALSGSVTATMGGIRGNANNIAFAASHPTYAPTSHNWLYTVTGNFSLTYGTSATDANSLWMLTGPTTAQQFGTGAALAGAIYPKTLMIGDIIANARRITNGTAAPSSSAHGAGEVCFNRTPTAAGVAQWQSSASGTPGTWLANYVYPRADATTGIGYVTGAGGAATQATSRTTTVPINKVCGQITLFSAAGSATWQTFTVTNTTVAATDVIRVVQASGTDLYQIHVTNVAAGSFKISFATTGGTTTEQPVFNFAVIKAVAA